MQHVGHRASDEIAQLKEALDAAGKLDTLGAVPTVTPGVGPK